MEDNSKSDPSYFEKLRELLNRGGSKIADGYNDLQRQADEANENMIRTSMAVTGASRPEAEAMNMMAKTGGMTMGTISNIANKAVPAAQALAAEAGQGFNKIKSMFGKAAPQAAEEIPQLTSALGKNSPNAAAFEVMNKARNARLDKLKGIQDIYTAQKLAKAKDLLK